MPKEGDDEFDMSSEEESSEEEEGLPVAVAENGQAKHVLRKHAQVVPHAMQQLLPTVFF